MHALVIVCILYSFYLLDYITFHIQINGYLAKCQRAMGMFYIEN